MRPLSSDMWNLQLGSQEHREQQGQGGFDRCCGLFQEADSISRGYKGRQGIRERSFKTSLLSAQVESDIYINNQKPEY